MPDNLNKPLPGVLTLDLTPLKSFLVDLPPGAMQGMRTEQEGYDEVVLEVTANQPDYGGAAGITPTDFAQLTTLNDQAQQLLANLPAARKMVEILEETYAQVDDKRQRLISAIAGAAESRVKAGADPSLLARYEKTRTYRSAIADKAAKTRKKNATAAKDAPAAPDAAPENDAGSGNTPPK